MKENSALVLEVQEQIYLKTIGTILAECVLYKHLFLIRLLKSSVKLVSEKTRLGKEENVR